MFGTILKNLRLEKEMTQEELGKILNKTKNNISQYETGKREPDNETLRKIADYFNVSIDYLLGKSSVRDPYKSKDNINSSMPDIPAKFTDANLAREYVSKHQIFGANGFKPNKMSDDEILEFANALLEQMELLSYKYKK